MNKKILPIILISLFSIFFIQSSVAEEAVVDAGECKRRATGGEESFTSDASVCDVPDVAEVTQGGFKEAPVVACPRPSKYFSDLLDKLNGIKFQIKNDVCKETVNEVEADLASLISTDREQFVSLVKQGIFGNGQLEPAQVQTMKNYVANVVGKASSIARSLNLTGENEACFEDEEKKSALSFVGSAISEVTGALGAVAGPFGAKLALGGEIAGQLMMSVGQIIDEKQQYDFDNSDDVRNYFNSLCTYYDLKSELDQLSNGFNKPKRLALLIEQIEGSEALSEDEVDAILAGPGSEDKEEVPGFFQIASQSCPVCGILIADYKLRQDQNLGYRLNGDDPLEVYKSGLDPRSEDNVNEILSLIPSDQVAAGNLSYEELLELAQKRLGNRYNFVNDPTLNKARTGLTVTESAPVPNAMNEAMAMDMPELGPELYDKGPKYTPPGKIKVDPESKQLMTIRALQLVTWVREEFRETYQESRERVGDDLRDDVVEAKNKLERILTKLIPTYINYITDELEQAIDQIIDYSEEYKFTGVQQNASFGIEPHPESKVKASRADRKKDTYEIRIVFNEFWRSDIDFASIVTDYYNSQVGGYYHYDDAEAEAGEVEDGREGVKAQLEELLTTLVDRHQAVVQKCEFFELSYFVQNRGQFQSRIKRACRNAKKQLARSQEIISVIKNETSFGEYHSYPGSALEHIFEKRPNYVTDFLGSISEVIKRDSVFVTLEVQPEDN